MATATDSVPSAGAEPASAPLTHRGAWRLLLGQVRPHLRTLIAGGAVSLLGGLAALAEPMVAKLVIDSLGEQRPLAGPVAVLTLLMLGGAVLTAVGMYLLGRTAESVVLSARQRMIGRMLRLQVGALDDLKPGDLLSRVMSDTTLLRSVTTYGLVHSLNGVLLMVVAVVLMATLDLVLLGVTVAVLAVNAVALLVVVPRIRGASTRSQEAVGGMGSVLERSLAALRTVKASNAERREEASLDEAVTRAWRRGVEVAKWTALMEVSAGLAVQLSFLAVLGIGGVRVTTGALSVSSLIAFLLYLFLLAEPVNAITNGVSQLQAGLGAVARMREVDELPVEDDEDDDVALPSVDDAADPAAITFDQVWFNYRYAEDRSWVHRGLSFSVPRGGVTALVGPSGTGKTTVFALLERFYEPTFGAVLIDGQDIREWTLPQLRSTIGYVGQDAPILEGTLRSNLRLAAPDADDGEIHAALEVTRLHTLLGRMPDGLDTPLGHHGVTLSGGEKQRIAIARALLRHPRILLLDEATSQLDAVNEVAMRDAITAVAQTTTVLVAAHRLSTVTCADRILVLEDGVVRASGTHDELVESDDLYRRLAETQLYVG
ncbi:MAG TPA: ABC transporter ATP-binding protein [Euzebyales bacterium]|nr:ABC transporter ATP-binding protein [Euzebyales bacterium]